MSAVVSAAEDITGGAVDTVGSVVSGAADVVQEVTAPIVQAVDNTIQAAANDPIGTAAKVAAVASGNPELIPLISGASVIANGGSVEQGLQAGAVTYAAGQVGAGVGSEVGSSTESALAGKIAGGVAGGATGAVLNGGDPVSAALAGGINAGVNYGANAAYNAYNAPSATPGGIQTASNDSEIPSVSVSGVPIYADSANAGSVSAPYGFDLMPSSLNEKGLLPEGAYYDATQNAWFAPNQDVTDLQQALQTAPESSGGDYSLGVAGPSVNSDGTSYDAPSAATSQLSSLSTDQKALYDAMVQMGASQSDALDTAIQAQSDSFNSALSDTTNTLQNEMDQNQAANTAQFGGINLKFGTVGNQISGISNAQTSLANQIAAQKAAQTTAANMIPDRAVKDLPTTAPLNPLLFSLAGFPAPQQQQTPMAQNMLEDMFYGTSLSSPAQRTVAQPAQEYQPYAEEVQSFAQGGLASVHPAGEPQFYSEGSLGNRYIKGEGDGTSDSIPAMVADSEFVMPADVVAALGNGSSDAGASKLDLMVQQIRARARSTGPSELPPPAHESPLDYLKGRK